MMLKSLLLVLALALALALTIPGARAADPLVFDDPSMEERYNELTLELRCLVCQNQNLADSNAELAVDLRRKTYEMVRQDKSEEEIADFMVDRYGEFVLYRPPLTSNTLLLWTGPFIILLIGVGLLMRTVRRRRAAGITDDVDDSALKTAATLLDTDRDKRDA